MASQKKRARWALFGIVLLVATAAAFSVHTMVSVEDAQTITGAKTFNSINGVLYADQQSGADIGAKINTAIGLLTHGGRIRIPCGSYSFSTGINADSTNNLIIEGDGGLNAGATACVKMTYTGTGTIVSARSTNGFHLSNVQIVASNAAFAGIGVDLSHATSSDTFAAEIDHSGFFGSGGATYSEVINADKAISSSFHDNNLNNYTLGIQGMSSGSSYSNANRVVHNHFSSSTGTAVTGHILNPGQGWFIAGNTFEMGTAAGKPYVLSCAASGSGAGLGFYGNWVGDDNASSSTTFFSECGGDYAGNYIVGGSTNATLWSFSAANKVSARGNELGGAVIFAFGSTVVTADIGANLYGTVSSFSSGTPFAGNVIDNNGITNNYTGFNSNAAINLHSGSKIQVNSLLISPTAPTVSSGFGSSPSIVSNNGTLSFQINVGTGGTATNGVIGLPTASHGWACNFADVTTQSSTVYLTKQIASTTSSATIANFNTAGAQAAWVASDVLNGGCTAF